MRSLNGITSASIRNRAWSADTYQIVSHEKWSSMSCCMFDREKHDTTNDWWDTEKCQRWPLLLCPSCERSTSQCSNDLHSSEWDIK